MNNNNHNYDYFIHTNEDNVNYINNKVEEIKIKKTDDLLNQSKIYIEKEKIINFLKLINYFSFIEDQDMSSLI